MDIKKLVDSYIEKNFKQLEEQRLSPGFNWANVAAQIGINGLQGEYVRGRFRLFKNKYGVSLLLVPTIKERISSIFSTITHSKDDKEKGTKEFCFTADEIPTEEQIIDHFKIDTSRYKINQIYHKTSFGGKYAVTVSLLALKGVDKVDFKKEFEDFVERKNLTIFNNFTEKYWEKNEINNLEKDCTVVINLADLHLGKLVSESETGEKYNIDIAKERFISSVKYLAQKSYQCYSIKKFILSTLGDTLHIDTLKSTTTAGTYVESDTRASKVFQTALDVITESIDILKEYAPEVEFININGNHCELSEQHLGIALKAYYRNDKQVKIDADPRNRKYRLIGENLLVWNHGDTNVATLPLTVATEQAEMWGKSKFRIVQLGHLHSTKKRVYQSEDEFNGVIVRHFSSLSGTDFWHDKNNFKGSQKRGTAIVYSDKEIGIIGEFYKTV